MYFKSLTPTLSKGFHLKAEKKEDLIRAYKELQSWCESRGFKPQLQKMDNETSKDVEDFIASQKTSQKYTPPDMYRKNPAERALQTYKSCIKSTIASLTPTFPISLWCKLLPQINLSVNIFRKCRQNPLLSAWAAMEGKYHFDSTPIAPAGSEMLMHEKSWPQTDIWVQRKIGVVHFPLPPSLPHLQGHHGFHRCRADVRHCEI